ncbi:hypothetical protein E2C01_043156 [Portunus trituberculatus]|uniref:Uncharacterized protein n=1 Tax=Portunus trituberculatus TaxID=210409 RepID=A0A5B7FVC2_PORTR|nr:hypothetical protein [Portunus trituberculatus]
MTEAGGGDVVVVVVPGFGSNHNFCRVDYSNRLCIQIATIWNTLLSPSVFNPTACTIPRSRYTAALTPMPSCSHPPTARVMTTLFSEFVAFFVIPA